MLYLQGDDEDKNDAEVLFAKLCDDRKSERENSAVKVGHHEKVAVVNGCIGRVKLLFNASSHGRSALWRLQ